MSTGGADKINADMASSLSDEEFQRLQTQLIDLRTRNYSLEETAKKCNNEMKILYERISHLEQELNRSNKIINKSKQVKQVESFILENESLQHKLQSQEDEFRLQNSTIIQELSLMIATNEKLEKQLKDSGKVVKKEENDSIEDDTELRKLRAENNILKKNLNDSHAKQEIQISELNEKLSSVNVGKSTAKNDICRTSESSLSSCECNSKNLRDELKEVEMKLEILTEENRIIVEELESFKLCAKAESDDLQEEVKKLNDKVKKKQESLIQLQQEKEKMYHRNINANEEITSLKDQEISQLKDMICRLQSQLNKSLEALEDHKNKSSKSTRQLEAKINEQLCQIEDLNRSDPEKVRLLEEEAVKLRSAAETAWIERDNQIRALKDSLAHGEILKQTVHQLENIKEEAERNASEANKLAEKRKSLLDQMAIHLQKTTDELNEEIRQQKSALTEKIRDLESALISEQKKCHKLEKYKEKVENLNAQIRSLESSKAQLEDRLEDSKNRMDEVQCSHVADVNDVRDRHSKQINDLTERRNEEVKDLNIQIELIKVQKTEFEELVLKLKQEAKDAVEDRKIQEKKGVGMVKDLKRQLHSERKRAEKLQERIQELLNESNNGRSSVEELLSGNVDGSRDKQTTADNASVGSWSMMSGLTNDNSHISSKNEQQLDYERHDQSIPSMDQEHQELISRVAELQQQKWDIEEKLNHLEISNSAMAEDLIMKSAIIQHYCSEGRSDPQPLYTDKLTVKRVVDFIKDKGDENLKEINRKLQRMLEETLMKNMHLQKDIEALSEQVVALSKHQKNET